MLRYYFLFDISRNKIVNHTLADNKKQAVLEFHLNSLNGYKILWKNI